MDIKNIEKTILKYNPLNLIKDDYIYYDEIYVKISNIENLTIDKLQNIFMEHFGDTRVLFEMRINSYVYYKIYNEICSK